MDESEELKMNLYKSRVSKLIELGFQENIGLDKESKFLKSVFSHKHIKNGIRAMTIYNFSQEEFDRIYKSAKHMIEFGERLQKRMNNDKKNTHKQRR